MVCSLVVPGWAWEVGVKFATLVVVRFAVNAEVVRR